MRRSEINAILKKVKAFLNEMNFKLPPWAYWSPETMQANAGQCQEIVQNMLGWDITDFGSGDFAKVGLFLFTIRNGNLKCGKKVYAEKIMVSEELQETPMHFHWNKMEDIINRGGGNLVVELYNATADDKLADTPVTASIDGIARTVEPGGKVVLRPGESICLEARVYHRFYGEPGKGRVLIGEVSKVNDDRTDNCFYEGVGRFPRIEEDEAPMHLLVSDYSTFMHA